MIEMLNESIEYKIPSDCYIKCTMKCCYQEMSK